jgi:hypothetical protein
MAANINTGAQRREPTFADDSDGLTPQTKPGQPEEQANEQTSVEPQVSEQSSESAGGGTSDSAPPSPPAAPSDEPAAVPSAVSYLRYGVGDTVILGAPSYARVSAYAANTIEEIAEPIETPIDAAPPPAPPPSLPPPEPLPPNPEPVDPLPVDPVPVDANPNDPTPIPMPKPGGNATPTPTPATQEPALPPTTNAPAIGGSAVTPQPPASTTPASSRREPYITPGLHVPPEQSPHYATALAYGHEHGYNDDEIMKLAVLMQNNRDQNMGREWLSLKPEVLRAAVNAVVRNPDNSFDVSGVFGGRRGYYDSALATQRININADGFALDAEFSVVGNAPLTPPAGWVLDQETTGGGDAGFQTQQFYRPSDEMLAANDIPYLPMMLSGFVQVMHGSDSELSVGADGGYHDLSLIDFHPDYGLVTTPDNYRPINNDDGLDQIVLGAILTIATYGVLSGAGAVIGTTAAGSGGVLTAAQALALSSALGTTISTGDLRQGFIAGLASFVGAEVSSYIVGPQGLALNVSRTTPWTMGNFVGSIVSGVVSGAIQGDWRRGLVNGLVSFAGNVIAHELKIPATIANAAIRALYDPQGALSSLINGLISDPGMEGIQRGEQREGAIQQLMAQSGMSREDASSVVDRLISEGGRLNTVTAQARAETQQQITWIRDAIDSGNNDTAANLLNGLVDHAMADNPGASRADISARLMQALGIEPASIGLTIGADGRVAVDRLFVRGDPDVDDNTSNELQIRNAMERLRAINPGATESELRAQAERAIRLESNINGIGQLRRELSDNEIRQIALGVETDRERVQAYADRLAAIPEDQRAFALTDIKNEMAQQLGSRLNEVLGIVPLPGMEPMTQQQLLRMVDVALGILPITGEASAFYELIYGRSPASQEEASRLWAAFGVVTAGYGRLGGRLMTAEQRAARELEYAGGGGTNRWNRDPPNRSKPSEVLGDTLGPPPAGMVDPAAHHLVGFGMADARAQRILNDVGITPNEAANGLWLSREQHNLTLGDRYKEWVGDQLKDVLTKPEALKVLDGIKDILRNLKPGDVPPWRQAGK